MPTMIPRHAAVIGLVAALAPSSVLDVGSGRGAFLRGLVAALPELQVHAIDLDAERAARLSTLGLDRVVATAMDATKLAFDDRSFDGVTLLEVLEHLPLPERAIREALRVARRFVIATVPAERDDDPAHLHHFDHGSLRELFEREAENVPGGRAIAVTALRVGDVPRHLFVQVLLRT